MGIVQKPIASSYFSKRRVISAPGFADVISRERFELICKFLHFIENESLPTYQGPPILFKIYPVICHLNIKFQTLYLPKHCHWWKLETLEGASVNKAVLTTKGFKVRNKKFRTVRMKNRIFVVFSCIYRQNHGPTVESDYSRHPQISSCSTGNFRTLVGRGHMLWIDDFFNSTELARKPKIEHSTDCVGTLGRNIQHLLYRIQLVECLFTKYARATETRSVPGWQASDNTVPRLTERHFLWKVTPKTEKSGVLCAQSTEKKKTSVYCCQICDVGLCLEDCFELYHAKLNYWGNDNYCTASI